MQNWKKTVAQRFGLQANSYDAHANIQARAASKLISMIPAGKEPSIILEVGCGTGTLTQLLAEKYPSSQILAIDISPEMIEIAGRKCEGFENINFMVADGENFTSDQKFDLIISNMTMQWFKNLPAAIQNLQKFLATNESQILLSRPAQTSFPEWQETLTQHKMPAGLLAYQKIESEKEIEESRIDYGSTLEFFRKMKTIGAATAHEGYTPMSPAQIKKLCHACDEKYGGTMTWAILYERIFAPKS